MNGSTRWTGGLLLAAAFALAGVGSAAHQDSDSTVSALRRDDRLLKRVTVQVAFVTLQEALEQVGQAAGVRLRADQKLAGENVLVLVRDRPATEVLEVLAQHRPAGPASRSRRASARSCAASCGRRSRSTWCGRDRGGGSRRDRGWLPREPSTDSFQSSNRRVQRSGRLRTRCLAG